MTAFFSQIILFFFRKRHVNYVAAFVLPLALIAWTICLCMGVFEALYNSPQDYQQGDMVRFLYLHVPASWLALGVYTLMTVTSVLAYVCKLPLGHVFTKSLSVPGMLCAFISLITGSLWGKPVWGTYWVWDARLTSMLILFFIYAGYTVLAYQKNTHLPHLERLAMLVIIGCINIPIIKWSVNFWFTLHQPPSIVGLNASKIDAVFHASLFWMLGAYVSFIVATTILLLRGNIMTIKNQSKNRMRTPQPSPNSLAVKDML